MIDAMTDLGGIFELNLRTLVVMLIRDANTYEPEDETDVYFDACKAFIRKVRPYLQNLELSMAHIDQFILKK